MKALLRSAVLACWLALGLSSLSLAQEWTRFRGPNGQGVSATSLPTNWTEKERAWSIDLPGLGHSSPVLWGEKLFVTSSVPETSERLVICVNSKTGEELWTMRFPGRDHKKHEFNSFASPTPVVDAERVWVCWSTPQSYEVVCLNHQGETIWSRDLGPYESQHSCGVSPILYDDLLIVPNDQDGPSSLVALRSATGEDAWKVEREAIKVSYSTPCVFEGADGKDELIFLSWSHGFTGIDPHTGSRRWEFKDAFDSRTVSSPVIAEDKILGTCGEGGGAHWLLAITPGGQGKPATETYRVTRSCPYVPTPIYHQGQVFICNDGGVFLCLDAKTGETLSQKRLGGNYFSSPVCADGVIYTISTLGEVNAIKADRTIETLGVSSLGDECHATPAIANGTIYIRTFHKLMAIRKP